MPESHESRERKPPRMVMKKILPVVALGCLAPLAILVLGPRVREGRMPPLDTRYGNISISDAKLAFSTTASNDDLVTLLQALCFRAQNGHDVGPDLADYGSLLLSRAKAGLVDLESLGPGQEEMLTMLSLIRRAMADRTAVENVAGGGQPDASGGSQGRAMQ